MRTPDQRAERKRQQSTGVPVERQRELWRAQYQRRAERKRQGEAWRRTVRKCTVCPNDIPRHELDTDRTYANRDVCSRACMSIAKGTQSDRGKMAWPRKVGLGLVEPQERDLP